MNHIKLIGLLGSVAVVVVVVKYRSFFSSSPSSTLEISGSPLPSHTQPVSVKLQFSGAPSDVLRELFSKNIQAAIDYLKSIEDGDLRGRMIGELAIIWTKTDCDACLAWATSLKNPNEKSSAMTGIILSLIAEKNSSKAFDIIKNFPSGELKDDMIVYGFTGLLKLDAKATLDLTPFLANKGAIEAVCRDLALKVLEDGDKTEWATIVRNLPEGVFRENLNLAIISDLVKTDPGAGFEWFKANPGFSNMDSLRILAGGYGNRAPEDGFKMGEGITNQLEKKQFLLNLGASWGRKDPKAAELWMMDDIQRGNYQKNKAAYDGILSEAIQWQHDEVFQKISSIQDESLREAVTLQAAGKLSQFDPKLAAEILSKLPNQQSKEHISTTATLTCNWLEKDPIKATMWVRSMSPGASKDVAISEVVKNVLKVDKDPSLATSWATEIQSITVRTRALERVEEMKRNDP